MPFVFEKKLRILDDIKIPFEILRTFPEQKWNGKRIHFIIREFNENSF